jgi:hypothetical protein
MERHCPRGQGPSRVVAPVKKKKSSVGIRTVLEHGSDTLFRKLHFVLSLLAQRAKIDTNNQTFYVQDRMVFSYLVFMTTKIKTKNLIVNVTSLVNSCKPVLKIK